MTVDPITKASYSFIEQRRTILSLDDREKKEVLQIAQGVGCLALEELFKERKSFEPWVLQEEFFQSPNVSLKDKVRAQFSGEQIERVSIKFESEPCVGGSTVFLVAPDLVLTTSHSVFNEAKKAHYIVIFGFFDAQNLSFPHPNVYKVQSVVAFSSLEKADWALLKLDRKVYKREPLTVDFSSSIHLHDTFRMLGHPYGTPQKLTGWGLVKAVDSPTLGSAYSEVSISAFAGNSGSPLFTKEGKIVGMLRSGKDDYGIVNGVLQELRPKGEKGIFEQVLKMSSLSFLRGFFANAGELSTFPIEIRYKTGVSLEGVCNNYACEKNKAGNASYVIQELGFPLEDLISEASKFSCDACKQALENTGIVLSSCTYDILAEKNKQRIAGVFHHHMLSKDGQGIKFDLSDWKICYLKVHPHGTLQRDYSVFFVAGTMGIIAAIYAASKIARAKKAVPNSGWNCIIS